jgi:hypothetical protein
VSSADGLALVLNEQISAAAQEGDCDQVIRLSKQLKDATSGQIFNIRKSISAAVARGGAEASNDVLRLSALLDRERAKLAGWIPPRPAIDKRAVTGGIKGVLVDRLDGGAVGPNDSTLSELAVMLLKFEDTLRRASFGKEQAVALVRFYQESFDAELRDAHLVREDQPELVDDQVVRTLEDQAELAQTAVAFFDRQFRDSERRNGDGAGARLSGDPLPTWGADAPDQSHATGCGRCVPTAACGGGRSKQPRRLGADFGANGSKRMQDLEEQLAEVFGVQCTPEKAYSRKHIVNLREKTEDEREVFTWYIDGKTALVDAVVQLICLILVPMVVTLFAASRSQGHFVRFAGGTKDYVFNRAEFIFGLGVTSSGVLDELDLADAYNQRDDSSELLWRPSRGTRSIGELENPRGMGNAYLGATLIKFVMFLYAAVMALRIVFNWAEPRPSVVRLVIYKVTGFFFLLLAWAGISWLMTGAVWMAFAAILDPARNLVKGVIVVVIFSSVAKLTSKLWGLRDMAMAFIRSELKAAIQEALKRTSSKDAVAVESTNIPTKLDEKDALAVDHLLLVPEIAALQWSSQEHDSFNPDQFRLAFTHLGIMLPPEQVERIYQYCDFDNNGFISAAEFEQGWKYVFAYIENGLLVQLGLDEASIMQAILWVLAFFAICIPMFLLMIGLWSNTSSFVSVTQSLFIGVTGLVASSQKQTAEDAKGNVKGLRAAVHRVMGNTFKFSNDAT